MQRNQSLDVLRCAAVLLTVGFHFPYYGIWGRIGWIGVDLFFVLSGFLISGLLFQEHKDTGSVNFKRFILRRGLKDLALVLPVLAIPCGLLVHKAVQPSG
jgi:peptidoglycan/LPS O-acetylase OafA/YrhL